VPGELPIPKFTDFELNALGVTATEMLLGSRRAEAPFLRFDASEEEKVAAKEEERKAAAEAAERKEKAFRDFSSALNERLASAYRAGESSAVDRADRNAWNARSITLYLVVLAVVAMPAIAMAINLDPQAFGSYIAPVTGIAGTVVGYWFGSLSRPGGRNSGTP